MSDTTRAVSRAYGALGEDDAAYPARISYLIDADGNIARAYAEVEPASHPDQVLADLT